MEQQESRPRPAPHLEPSERREEPYVPEDPHEELDDD